MFNIGIYREIKDFIKKNAKNSVKIIAISKNHPRESVNEAISAGVRVFGENRVQEAQDKFLPLRLDYQDIELHLTGPLQTNKVKQALKMFDVFQTLDREKLAKEFFKYQNESKNKKFFVQINTGKEKNKSGVFPEDSSDFIKYCTSDLKFYIDGLMCIPPINEDPNEHFGLLKIIAEKNNIKNLSMGMSSDYECGITCGATHIRIGTKLFGKRNEL
jgi:pyridoxal phosphate enzyme (YggS family)